MARCDALITGKFSSRYFERIHGDCNQSLSIRIQQGFRVELFSKYLLDVAGYSEVRRKQYVQKVSIIEVRFCTMISVSDTLADAFTITGLDIQELCQRQA